jgi:hypothetical protein
MDGSIEPGGPNATGMPYAPRSANPGLMAVERPQASFSGEVLVVSSLASFPPVAWLRHATRRPDVQPQQGWLANSTLHMCSPPKIGVAAELDRQGCEPRCCYDATARRSRAEPHRLRSSSHDSLCAHPD